MIPDLQAVENRTDKSLQNLLVFRLGAQAFALSIEVVVQIIPMMKLTPLPQSDAIIEGVANIRGTISPMMNVRRRLDMEPLPARLHTPIILIRLGSHLIGLIVDEVIDILSLPTGQVAHPDQILPEGVETSKVLEGVIFLENHNILLLNPYALVMPATAALRSNLGSTNHGIHNPHPVENQEEPETTSDFNPPAGDLISDLPEVTLPQPVVSSYPEVKTEVAVPPPTQVLHEVVQQPVQPPAPKNAKKRKGGQARLSNAEKVLAEHVATLAVELPPADGESFAKTGPTPATTMINKPEGNA